MRGVIATLVAFIVLYTLACTYPSLKTNTFATLKEERNLETIAAWIMFRASCNDVDSYLARAPRLKHLTPEPLPTHRDPLEHSLSTWQSFLPPPSGS